jgi:hypothetical protein
VICANCAADFLPVPRALDVQSAHAHRDRSRSRGRRTGASRFVEAGGLAVVVPLILVDVLLGAVFSEARARAR